MVATLLKNIWMHPDLLRGSQIILRSQNDFVCAPCGKNSQIKYHRCFILVKHGVLFNSDWRSLWIFIVVTLTQLWNWVEKCLSNLKKSRFFFAFRIYNIRTMHWVYIDFRDFCIKFVGPFHVSRWLATHTSQMLATLVGAPSHFHHPPFHLFLRQRSDGGLLVTETRWGCFNTHWRDSCFKQKKIANYPPVN